jgi:hypothetical protein
MKKLIILSFSLFTFLSSFAAGACACGVAPERENDFFWENDKFGMRAYGPGEYHVWSGLDVFNKMPGAMSVGELLHGHHNCGNWHVTPANGVLDNYAVGAGRGLGAVALFGDGEWKTYPNWIESKIIANTDELCEFELVYPAFSALGRMTYRITLKKGDRFFRNDVSFQFPDRIREFRFGPGLDLDPARGHKGDVFEDAKLGIVSLFEDSRGETEGSTATAMILDPKDAEGAELMTDRVNCRVLSVRRPSFTYWAGCAWSKAGEITSAAQWHETVRNFRKELTKK